MAITHLSSRSPRSITSQDLLLAQVSKKQPVQRMQLRIRQPLQSLSMPKQTPQVTAKTSVARKVTKTLRLLSLPIYTKTIASPHPPPSLLKPSPNSAKPRKNKKSETSKRTENLSLQTPSQSSKRIWTTYSTKSGKTQDLQGLVTMTIRSSQLPLLSYCLTTQRIQSCSNQAPHRG